MKKVLSALIGLTLTTVASAQHVIIIQQHRLHPQPFYIQENPAATPQVPWGYAQQQFVPVYPHPRMYHAPPPMFIPPNAGATPMYYHQPTAPRYYHYRRYSSYGYG